MREIEVFIAGSKDLGSLRDSARAALVEIGNQYRELNIIYRPYTFEDFDRSVVVDGQQSKYNQYISETAANVIFIFDEGFGNRTMEELEVAFASYSKNGRPLIYIYCNKDKVVANDNFEKVLVWAKEHDQYYIEYEDGHFKEKLKEDFTNILVKSAQIGDALKPEKKELRKQDVSAVPSTGNSNEERRVVYWSCKAVALLGDPEAQMEMGEFYANGDGVVQDYAEAVKWYRKAAEQGYVEAQVNLAYCYYEGSGVQQDYAEAVKWYREAAEKGSAKAQFSLGACSEFSLGVGQDYTQATKWYRKAAEQGHAEAQGFLGVCYYNALGVARDYHQAAQWYRKAAEQGVDEAQKNMGVCYANGHGVAQDYVQAMKWFRMAAEQGNAVAQKYLADCYAMGYREAE